MRAVERNYQGGVPAEFSGKLGREGEERERDAARRIFFAKVCCVFVCVLERCASVRVCCILTKKKSGHFRRNRVIRGVFHGEPLSRRDPT